MPTLNKFTTRVMLLVLIIGIALVAAIALNRPTATTMLAATAFVPDHSAEASAIPAIISPAPMRVARVPSARVKAIGSLMPANQATLAFQMSGRVKQIKIKEGDFVQAGFLLAALDTTSLEFQIAQAQAALDLAATNLDKVKAGPVADDVALAKSKLDLAGAAVRKAQAAYDRIGGASNPFVAMTQQALELEQATQTYQGALATYHLTVNHPTVAELKTAQAQVAQAQAALELAKQNLTNAKIFAPFDGKVVWVGAHAGESVTLSAPIVMIADLSAMQAQINLDENDLAVIRIGQSAQITVDALDKTLTGRVGKIGPLGTTVGAIVSVPVTIDIDATDDAIYPGLSATVEIQVNP